MFVDVGQHAARCELQAGRAIVEAINDRFTPPPCIGYESVDANTIVNTMYGHLPFRHLIMIEMDGGQPLTTPPNTKEEGKLPSGFTIPLSIAFFYAQVSKARSVYLGVIKDITHHRPNVGAFFGQWVQAIDSLNQGCSTPSLETPFLDKYKAEVVQLGDQLKVPFELSWSCPYFGFSHCGGCYRCRCRRQAFVDAGVKDPTSYGQ